MAGLFLIIGLVFAPLAGAIAFLITFQEYRKHRFSGKPLYQAALRAGLLTFAFFLLLALALGYALPFIV